MFNKKIKIYSDEIGDEYFSVKEIILFLFSVPLIGGYVWFVTVLLINILGR